MFSLAAQETLISSVNSNPTTLNIQPESNSNVNLFISFMISSLRMATPNVFSKQTFEVSSLIVMRNDCIYCYSNQATKDFHYHHETINGLHHQMISYSCSIIFVDQASEHWLSMSYFSLCSATLCTKSNNDIGNYVW
jgi:hypothetical protein